ncbi:MAG: hypothetical protein GXY32_05785 [Ruminococcaceae bacterium]|nr:hypothetical protein [Oscillospiraceae bacterium]
MNNEEKILQMLGELTESYKELTEGQKELTENYKELTENYRGLNQRVAKMEIEHGRKIDLILENQIDNNRNIEDLQQRMESVEDKLDNAIIIKAVK